MQTAAAADILRVQTENRKSSPPQALASSPPHQANARNALSAHSFLERHPVVVSTPRCSVPRRLGGLLCY